nr:hypothetical protein OHB51_20280 [Micromonospora sp. NBC_00855]
MDIYFESHGNGEGRPPVLIHGALSGIGTSFGTSCHSWRRTGG